MGINVDATLTQWVGPQPPLENHPNYHPAPNSAGVPAGGPQVSHLYHQSGSVLPITSGVNQFKPPPGVSQQLAPKNPGQQRPPFPSTDRAGVDSHMPNHMSAPMARKLIHSTLGQLVGPQPPSTTHPTSHPPQSSAGVQSSALPMQHQSASGCPTIPEQNQFHPPPAATSWHPSEESAPKKAWIWQQKPSVQSSPSPLQHQSGSSGSTIPQQNHFHPPPAASSWHPSAEISPNKAWIWQQRPLSKPKGSKVVDVKTATPILAPTKLPAELGDWGAVSSTGRASEVSWAGVQEVFGGHAAPKVVMHDSHQGQRSWNAPKGVKRVGKVSSVEIPLVSDIEQFKYLAGSKSNDYLWFGWLWNEN